MNFNATYNSTEKASIACSDNHGEYTDTRKAHGDGHYDQKAYNPKIKVVCEYEHILLRTVETCKVQYEILWEGEVLNKYSTLKIAESFFMDFAGITKSKYSKLKRI